MNKLRITGAATLAIGWGAIAVPLHAQTSLPEIGATQHLVPERSELQLNPDPDVFPPGPDLFFGDALSLRRNELLIGMTGYDGGRVAFFTRKRSGEWQRAGSLDPSDAAQTHRFGSSVALGRTLALVQAEDGTYVFRRAKMGWRQTQKLATRFSSMAISDDFVFGGIEEAIAVFRPDKGGRLQRVQTLTAQQGTAGASFGKSLAASRDILVVGAPDDSEQRGAVHIFRRYGQKWREQQQLIAINGAPGDAFGASVAIDRRLIAIGAPGAQSHGPDCSYVRGVAYVFAPYRGLWFERQKIEMPDCEPSALNFGHNVGIGRGKLAVVVPLDFPIQLRRAFIYENLGGTYIPIAVTTGRLEHNGNAMQMSGSTLVLGWPFARGGYSPGFAETFELGPRCLIDITASPAQDDEEDDRERACH